MLDKSVTEVKQEVVKATSAEYNISQKDIRSTITTKRTTQTNNEASVIIRSAKLELYKHFRAVQQKWEESTSGSSETS